MTDLAGCSAHTGAEYATRANKTNSARAGSIKNVSEILPHQAHRLRLTPISPSNQIKINKMNISSIFSAYSANQSSSSAPSGAKQFAKDLTALETALESGNLTDAQTAFAAFAKDVKSSDKGNPFNSSNDSSDTLANDLKAVETALKTGDISSAQQAFATLKTDMEAARKARGTGPQPPPDDSQDDSTSSTGSLADDIKAVAKALNSGDVTTAQQAFATLQADMQAKKAHGHAHGHGPQPPPADSQDASISSTGSLSDGLNALEAALKSGDVSTAQQAFASMSSLFLPMLSGSSVTQSTGTFLDTYA